MSAPFSFVDLFSGAGGMTCGFDRHPAFRVIAAADAERGKPSMGEGTLQCNSTFAANMGIKPERIDLADIAPPDLAKRLGISQFGRVDVLSVCPPCTGFSRANPENHLRDDPRNSLVKRAADFAIALGAEIVVMENARELLRGNFTEHFAEFRATLEAHGYKVAASNYFLSRFGLPQKRERAIVIARKGSQRVITLDDLWRAHEIDEKFKTVKKCFEAIPSDAQGLDEYPSINDRTVKARMAAIPRNGGSWADLMKSSESIALMTPAMKRLAERGKLGSHPDVYGRMSWHMSAPTIKRECAHVGNGRYAHPEEDRLCSVREMASIQGFPHDFVFMGTSLSNKYRHIGDAVPPLISHQLAHICEWMLSGKSKTPKDALLPKTHLSEAAILSAPQFELLDGAA